MSAVAATTAPESASAAAGELKPISEPVATLASQATVLDNDDDDDDNGRHHTSDQHNHHRAVGRLQQPPTPTAGSQQQQQQAQAQLPAHNHQQQMHVCRLCDKLLSSSSSLDRHMLTHSGVRPFVCKRCHMTFTTNGNMHRHMRTHLHKDSLVRDERLHQHQQLKLAAQSTNSVLSQHHHHSTTGELSPANATCLAESQSLLASSSRLQHQQSPSNSMLGATSTPVSKSRTHNQTFGHSHSAHSIVSDLNSQHQTNNTAAVTTTTTSINNNSSLSSTIESLNIAAALPTASAGADANLAKYLMASLGGSVEAVMLAAAAFAAQVKHSPADIGAAAPGDRHQQMAAPQKNDDDLNEIVADSHQYDNDQDDLYNDQGNEGEAEMNDVDIDNNERLEPSARRSARQRKQVNPQQASRAKLDAWSSTSSTRRSDSESPSSTINEDNDDELDIVATSDGRWSTGVDGSRQCIEDVDDDGDHHDEATSTSQEPVANSTDDNNNTQAVAVRSTTAPPTGRTHIDNDCDTNNNLELLDAAASKENVAAGGRLRNYLAFDGIDGAADKTSGAGTFALAGLGGNFSATAAAAAATAAQNQRHHQLEKQHQLPEQYQTQIPAAPITTTLGGEIIEDISQSYVKTANPNAAQKGGKRNRHCYKCKLCTYSSVDRCTLVRHLRIHSGERPYICGICRYAFTTKANCERHVRKRHKKQYNSLGGAGGGVKGGNGGGRSLIITDHTNHQTIPVKVNPIAAQNISQTLRRIQAQHGTDSPPPTLLQHHQRAPEPPQTPQHHHQQQPQSPVTTLLTDAGDDRIRVKHEVSVGDSLSAVLGHHNSQNSNNTNININQSTAANKRQAGDRSTLASAGKRRMHRTDALSAPTSIAAAELGQLSNQTNTNSNQNNANQFRRARLARKHIDLLTTAHSHQQKHHHHHHLVNNNNNMMQSTPTTKLAAEDALALSAATANLDAQRHFLHHNQSHNLSHLIASAGQDAAGQDNHCGLSAELLVNLMAQLQHVSSFAAVTAAADQQSGAAPSPANANLLLEAATNNLINSNNNASQQHLAPQSATSSHLQPLAGVQATTSEQQLPDSSSSSKSASLLLSPNPHLDALASADAAADKSSSSYHLILQHLSQQFLDQSSQQQQQSQQRNWNNSPHSSGAQLRSSRDNLFDQFSNQQLAAAQALDLSTGKLRVAQAAALGTRRIHHHQQQQQYSHNH